MSRENKYGLLAALLAFVILFFFFGKIITQSNSSMMAVSGDGLKNYFSVLYYLQNDSGTHFTGMNYPFGEHFSFADGMPGMIIPLKYLSNLFPAIKNWGYGIINLLCILNYVLCVFFFYKILMHFKVNVFLSITGALLISFLSPQLFRIEAHYALSIACFFPMVWFGYLKMELANKKWKWTLLLMSIITFSGLIHFYHVVMVTLFLLSLALIKLILQFKQRNWKHHLFNFVFPIFPIVLLQIFMSLTDKIADRPPKPWGFFFAKTTWDSFLLPHPKDLLGMASRELPGFGEGFAYIGIIAILVIIASTIRLVIKHFHSPLKYWKQKISDIDFQYLLAAVLVLLFALAIPFSWGLEKTIDYIPFLHQFRAIGRFAWVFYYVAGVGAIQYLYSSFKLFSFHRLQKTGVFIVGIALTIWGAEDIYRLKTIANSISYSQQNYLDFNDAYFTSTLKNNRIDKSKFQAIISFPFYHIGSEQFAIEQFLSQQQSMKASVQLQLPIIDVMLSRTSTLQSCQTIQLMSDSLLAKPILEKFTDKHLLLIACGNSFSEQENKLIAKSTFIRHDGDVTLYELPLTAFATHSERIKNNFAQKETALSKCQNDAWADKENCIFETAFCENNKGIFADYWQSATEEETIVFHKPIAGLKIADTLEVSLWVKVDPQFESLPVLQYQQVDSTGRQVALEEFGFKYATDIYQQSVLLRKPIILSNPQNIVVLKLIRKCSYSNLMIRNKHTNIYQPIKGFGFYFNNIPIKL